MPKGIGKKKKSFKGKKMPNAPTRKSPESKGATTVQLMNKADVALQGLSEPKGR